MRAQVVPNRDRENGNKWALILEYGTLSVAIAFTLLLSWHT